jgi:hypothetical protein
MQYGDTNVIRVTRIDLDRFGPTIQRPFMVQLRRKSGVGRALGNAVQYSTLLQYTHVSQVAAFLHLSPGGSIVFSNRALLLDIAPKYPNHLIRIHQVR